MTPLPLDPLSFPLHGSRLIEASAGTGKTFTIALLYLRLVLGHGDSNAFSQPLAPPQILVVTFTDAATQELRDRIRARLASAAACFAEPTAAHDSLLEALRSAYPPEQWPACAQRLQLAGEWMDEAAVSTIHGWCYRMLREHAFDSGSLFSQSLETDQRELFSDVVRDYWRSHFYNLPLAQAMAIGDTFSGPEALEHALLPLLPRVDAQFCLDGEPLPAPEELPALLAGPGQWYEQVPPLQERARELWRMHQQGLEAVLQALRPSLNGNSYRNYSQDAVFTAALAALAAWANGEAAPANIERFGYSGFKLKAKVPAPEHPAFHAIDAWLSAEAAKPVLRPQLLLHALAWVRRRFDQEKRTRAQIGFDDLLLRLDHALQGPAGARLAQSIREQYPVALIDEFQDTDPVQYRIFDTVYRVADNAPGCGLFMIGDPKQAIYSFRGADIYTYLQARQATAGRHYTLGTNYRSTAAMVAAVNHCFAFAEQHPRGAFRFAQAGTNPVPFTAVAAQGRSDVLELNGVPAQALTFWRLPQDGLVNKRTYLNDAAEACASAIQGWLASGNSGLRNGEHFIALRPADVAILVRNRTEAETIRAALGRRQLASVYLSDRDSVFASDEARDLLFILRACAQPASDPLLRAALATHSLGLPWQRLEQLNHNERYWEDQVELFRQLRKVWQQQGVLPMLRRLFNHYEVPARLLQASGGERRLTNLLHLAEWLQRSAAEVDGELALIRHLAEQLSSASEEEILRLESDADLVKVVTVHKSKGLEYPLVLLPFACSTREIDARSSAPPLFHAAGNALTVEMGKGQARTDAFDAANDERLGEEMRLLYVALTRARYATWVCMAEQGRAGGKTTELGKGALGYVLAGEEKIDAGSLDGYLHALATDSAAVSVAAAPAATAGLHPRPQTETLGPALAPPAKVRQHWWIASYSALALAEGLRSAGVGYSEPATALEANLREEPDSDPAVQPEGSDIHGFPRGAGPGTFLHGLFEWAGREGFGLASSDPERLRNAVARRCNLRDWERWIDPLVHWLTGYLAMPIALPGQAPLRLAELAQYQVEMEFWFASHAVPAAEIDRVVTAGTLGQARRPLLAPSLLNGMFKGFIDLAFAHDGRYYVADFKSNWLGDSLAAYTPLALGQAMLEKRYDLQLCLYLLALHRQLSARLPGYDYDQHIGGALYLFVRGGRHGIYLERPAREVIETLDLLFQGQRAEASA